MYLEEYYTDVRLLPADHRLRAQALTRTFEVNNLSVVAGEVVYYVRRTPADERNAGYLLMKHQALADELAVSRGPSQKLH